MKERPILYAGPMVRAVLEDRKTKTRRVVKGMALDWLNNANFTPEYVASPGNDLCPYGQPGDRMWVRECFAAWWDTATGKRLHAMGYRADIDDPDWDGFGADDPWWLDAKWEPSIHMPRALSRITLEITGVRVERLQDISEADAIAEGIIRDRDGWRGAPDLPWFASPVAAFRSLWESINGAGSWDVNPFVWVIEFRRIEQEAKAA